MVDRGYCSQYQVDTGILDTGIWNTEEYLKIFQGNRERKEPTRHALNEEGTTNTQCTTASRKELSWNMEYRKGTQ